MLRTITRLFLVLAFTVCLTGCAEDEIKQSHETQSQTESTPTDSSPGEMIVE